MNYGKRFPKKLRIMAGMLNMGERIKFGSDAELMYIAADKIEQAEELLSRAAKTLGKKTFPDTPDADLLDEIDLFLGCDDDD